MNLPAADFKPLSKGVRKRHLKESEMAFFSQMDLDKEQVNNYYNKTARFHTTDDCGFQEFLDFPQFSPEVSSDGLCSLRKQSDSWENANQISASSECKSFINTASGVSIGSLMKLCFVGPHPEEAVISDVSQQAVSLPDDLSGLAFNTFDAFDYIEESGSSVTMGSRCIENDFFSVKLTSAAQCFGHGGGSFKNIDVQSACQGDRKLAYGHDEHLPSVSCCSWSTDNIYMDLTSQNSRIETAETIADEKVKCDDGNEGNNLSNCSLMIQQNDMKIPEEESCDTTTFSASTFVSIPSVKGEADSCSQTNEYISHLDNSSTVRIGAIDFNVENSRQTDMSMPELQGTRSAGNTQLVERHVPTRNQREDAKSTFRNMSQVSFLRLLQQTQLSLSTNMTNDQRNPISQCHEFGNMPKSCRVNTSAEHQCTTVQMSSPLPVESLSESVANSQLYSENSDLQNASCQYYKLKNVIPIPRRNKAATEQEYTTSYLEQLPSESIASSQLLSTYVTNDRQNTSSQCFEFQNMPVSSRINTATEHKCTVQSPQNMPVFNRINTATEYKCNNIQSPSEDTSSSQLFSAHITNDLQDAVSQCYKLKNMPVSRRINMATEQVCMIQSPSESIDGSELFSVHMLSDQQNTGSQCYEFQNMQTSSRVNTLSEHECTDHVEQFPSENAASSHFSGYMTNDLQNPRSPCYKFQGIMPKSNRINTAAEYAERSSEIITDSGFSDLQGSKEKNINSLTSKSKTYMKVGKRGCYVTLPVNKVNQLMVRDLLSLSGNKEETSIRAVTENFRNNKRRMLEQRLKRLNHMK